MLYTFRFGVISALSMMACTVFAAPSQNNAPLNPPNPPIIHTILPEFYAENLHKNTKIPTTLNLKFTNLFVLGEQVAITQFFDPNVGYAHFITHDGGQHWRGTRNDSNLKASQFWRSDAERFWRLDTVAVDAKCPEQRIPARLLRSTDGLRWQTALSEKDLDAVVQKPSACLTPTEAKKINLSSQIIEDSNKITFRGVFLGNKACPSAQSNVHWESTNGGKNWKIMTDRTCENIGTSQFANSVFTPESRENNGWQRIQNQVWQIVRRHSNAAFVGKKFSGDYGVLRNYPVGQTAQTRQIYFPLTYQVDSQTALVRVK